MNRLSNYFDNAKLARLYILQAKERIDRKKTNEAVNDLCRALEYLAAAMNNVASIAFGAKPHRRKNALKK